MIPQKQRLLLSLAMVGWLMLSAGCSEKDKPAVLAQVGPISISVEEFQHELEFRRKGNLQITTKADLLQDLITRKALLLKAQELRLETDYELRRAQENLLIGKVREQNLDSLATQVKVEDAELKEFYDRNINRYTSPAKVRLAMLFLQASGSEATGTLKRRLEEAETLAAQLPMNTAGFGKLAIDYTDDQASRYRGGDVGWFTEGQPTRWPEEVVTTGFALKQGECSKVIRADNGFYIVKKTDSRGATITPLAQVADSIRRRIVSEKQKNLEHSFLEQSRKAINIVTNTELLESIPFSPSVMAGNEMHTPPSLP